MLVVVFHNNTDSLEDIPSIIDAPSQIRLLPSPFLIASLLIVVVVSLRHSIVRRIWLLRLLWSLLQLCRLFFRLLSRCHHIAFFTPARFILKDIALAAQPVRVLHRADGLQVELDNDGSYLRVGHKFLLLDDLDHLIGDAFQATALLCR